MIRNRDAQFKTLAWNQETTRITDTLNRRQHELLTHYNDMKMETIDIDNGEVSIRRIVATARWNLLEDNIQLDLMILDYHDETRSLFSQLGPSGLMWSVREAVVATYTCPSSTV
jgi:hypothetical protein